MPCTLQVEKVLIGKTLGSGTTPTSIISSAACSRDKANHSSNLRTVKTRNHSGILRKPTTDPNLLNNSYDYEDEVVVGYSSLVGTSLRKGSESGGSRGDTLFLFCRCLGVNGVRAGLHACMGWCLRTSM